MSNDMGDGKSTGGLPRVGAWTGLLISCVGHLRVREGLCDLAVSDAQYGYAAHVFILTDTERVLPAIDRAIFGDPYVFDFKGASSIEHHGLPECDISVVPFVSRAGGRWLHGLHY